MASRKSKKTKGDGKKRPYAARPPLASPTTRRFTRIAGRVFQLLALVAIFYGLSNGNGLIDAYHQWNGEIPIDPTLARSWLGCFFPFFLGSSLFAYVEQSLGRLRAMEKSIEEKPREPWLANPDWKNGCIRTEERRMAHWVGYSLFAFVFTVISLSISLQWGITSGLCWLGGFLSVLFVFNLLRDAKHHATQLKLRTIPGVIGGALAADFITKQTFAEHTLFEATLLCDHYIPPEDDSPGKRVSLWSDTIETTSRRDSQTAHSTLVPIRFTIPWNCQNSSLDPATDGPNKDVRWKLSVKPKGVLSRTASFIVPVFRTTESRPTNQVESGSQEIHLPPLDSKSELKSHGIETEVVCQSRTQWVFRRRQPVRHLSSICVIALIIAGIVLMAIFVPRWITREAMTLVAFLAFLPVVVVAVVFCTLVSDLLWICRITHHEQSLEIVHGYKGFRKTIRLPRDLSTSLSLERFAKLEVGELWDMVLIHPSLARKILLVKRIESKRQAIQIQEELANQLGVRAEGN